MVEFGQNSCLRVCLEHFPVTPSFQALKSHKTVPLNITLCPQATKRFLFSTFHCLWENEIWKWQDLIESAGVIYLDKIALQYGRGYKRGILSSVQHILKTPYTESLWDPDRIFVILWLLVLLHHADMEHQKSERTENKLMNPQRRTQLHRIL